jgi:hypothetical protein
MVDGHAAPPSTPMYSPTGSIFILDLESPLTRRPISNHQEKRGKEFDTNHDNEKIVDLVSNADINSEESLPKATYVTIPAFTLPTIGLQSPKNSPKNRMGRGRKRVTKAGTVSELISHYTKLESLVEGIELEGAISENVIAKPTQISVAQRAGRESQGIDAAQA